MLELAESTGTQTPPAVAMTRPPNVSSNAKRIIAAALSACLDHSPQQGSYTSESSSYFSSATSSSAMGLISSEISSSSDSESPSEEINVSSAGLVTVSKGEQKVGFNQIEAGSKAPLLKGAGKSDCSVCVVSIQECERDVPIASLSDENTVWNSEKMQAILENAGSLIRAPNDIETLPANGSRASQVQKALRRPLLPHRNRSQMLVHRNRQAGVTSPRLYVNEKTLLRLSSGQWAVRKQAFRGGKQDGSRLLKQIQKQVIYSATCRTNPIIAMISTPEVYGIRVPTDESSEGSIVVDMEYIPFNDVRSVILEQDKTIHDWFIGSAISVIDQELTQSSTVTLETILPEFRKKASGINANLPESSLLAPGEVQAIAQYFEIILARYTILQDLEIPVGTSHGDLTLQNMLVDPVNRELCVFDFLDCFVESPLQDIAKLLQDCRHQWFFTQADIPVKDMPRVATALESFNTRIFSAYYNYAFWEAVPLFEFFTLARILPYMTQLNEKQCIMNGLRCIIQGLGQNHSDRITTHIDGECRAEGATTTTVIVPALGDDMGDVYPDGQIKLLANKQNGWPLIVDCLSNLALDNVSSVIVAVPRPLVRTCCGTTNNFEKLFRSLGEEKYSKIRFFYAEKTTADAVETVTVVIENFGIRGPIFIKAADNRFTHSVDIGNYLSVSEVLKDRSLENGFRPDLVDATEKNFVTFSYDNVVSNISHRKAVSPRFCCGGWAFLEGGDFVSAAAKLRSLLQNAREISSNGPSLGPLKIVDAIWQLMSLGHLFFGVKVTAYDDRGSRAAWMASRGRD